MRIHHLNCGTMCPVGGRLMSGPGRGGRLVCHCLLLETGRGLVLVDTGLGMRDVQAPVPRLSRFFLSTNRLRLDPEETALRQVQRLGFAARDVRHVVLTHLDFDHAGGLDDFPEAQIHLFGAEVEAAAQRRTPVQRGRYRPEQWDGTARWTLYAAGGEPWFGFACVRGLEGLPPEILLIPLPGHTPGHCGVAIGTAEGWLLHAGDAYFFQAEMDPHDPWCPIGLRAYQRLMEADRRARLHNQARLRTLAREQAGQVQVFSAHDPAEFVVRARRNPAPERAASAA